MTYKGITGTVFGAAPNQDPGVICGANLDLSGIIPAGQVGNSFSADGELWIGSTASSAGGTHSKIGKITSNDGSISILNGSGTINLSGSAQGFQPNAVVQIFDDFFSQNGWNPPGSLGWNSIGSAPLAVDNNPDHPGAYAFQSLTATQGIILDQSTNGNYIVVGGGIQSFNYVWDLVTLSVAGNRYTAIVGLQDGNGATPSTPANGIYFSYSDNVNSGNWVLNCVSSSTTTSVNTSVAAATGFTQFGVLINAAGTSVSFFINNTMVGTAITTHIPSASICPIFALVRSSGSTPASQFDLFWYVKNLSNPRPGPVAGAIPGNSRWVIAYTQTATNYQVLGTDAIIGVSNTAAPRTITMPASGIIAGQKWTIKDESLAAAAHNITVSGNGFLIDGIATTVISTNGGSIDLYFNGSAYYLT